MTDHYARCGMSAASFVAALADVFGLKAGAVDPAAVPRLQHDPEKWIPAF